MTDLHPSSAGTSRARSLEADLLGARMFRWTAFLACGAILLLALGHFGMVFVPGRWPSAFCFHFNLDGEGNLATWVNSVLLLAASAAACLVRWMLGACPAPGASMRIPKVGWSLIAFVFFFLAADDAAQIHDAFSGSMARIAGSIFPSIPERLLWYAWIPIYMLLGAGTVLILLPTLRRTLFRDWAPARLVSIGFFSFLANPVIEVLENRRVDLLPDKLRGARGIAALAEFDPAAWRELQGLIILEEVLEMAGATCFLLGFLRYGRTLLAGRP